jgi:hypothetical protein
MLFCFKQTSFALYDTLKSRKMEIKSYHNVSNNWTTFNEPLHAI